MSSNISSNHSTLFTKDNSTQMSSNTNSPTDNGTTADSSPAEGIMEQYYVLERKARSYFTAAEINHSQEIRGFSTPKENKSRVQWCSFIVAVGNKLGFPLNTITTSQILFNRFYLFHPEKDFSTQNQKSDLSITCLFVATKIEETYKKLRDILIEAYKVRHPEILDVNSDSQIFEEQRKRIIQMERLVVETICFDFHICPPHQLLMKFVKKYKAAASILLAAKLLHKTNFPETRGGVPWYEVFLCKLEDIEEICRQLLDHFMRSDSDDPMYDELMKLKISFNSTAVYQTLNGIEGVRPLIQPIEGDQKQYTVRYTFRDDHGEPQSPPTTKNYPVETPTKERSKQQPPAKCNASNRHLHDHLFDHGHVLADNIRAFFERFEDGNSRNGEMDIDIENDNPENYKYLRQLASNRAHDGLLHRIQRNVRRYIDLFYQVIDNKDDGLMPKPTKTVGIEDDAIDVLMQHRKDRDAQRPEGDRGYFPATLTRRYTLYFKPLKDEQALSIRKVGGFHVGQLVTVQGIITRVHDVKPFLVVAGFTCEMCGEEVFQEVTKKTYHPLVECPSENCRTNNVRGKLHMQTRSLPVGHIPRSMTIFLYGPLTRTTNPGDIVSISGIFQATPHQGHRSSNTLLTDVYLEGQNVRQLKKQYDKMDKDPIIQQRVRELARDPNIYTLLAKSIAPEIYGHEDVKRALLLQLIGGVTKTMGDGMKIRGDLNICLMGDPGVAKSQLLKYICKVAPRGVYTTGRGSSGVGLTASVERDPVTDEMILEGGALVLADNGICCIDEFDKMEDGDRTAIHEVMEQQTISISKAGITTTLNARTSILAAANPIYGRYNPKLSPTHNINLPAALMSRFDILFLILDRPNFDLDEALAHHVAHVHRSGTHPTMDTEVLDVNTIRHYIAEARTKRPIVPSELGEYIVDSYVKIRQEQANEQARKKEHSHISPRTILAVIRMATALARIRLADKVEREDVQEALRLLEVSKDSLKDKSDPSNNKSSISAIYAIINDIRDREDNSTLDYNQIAQEVTSRYTGDQLEECILEYEKVNIWKRNDEKTTLTYINREDDD
ncbi:9050_t:CDS:10 [Diversispora eburnea]|uniref:DNA replication licensing factor MCM7 n=1 Tax=Diversispora eburnea TaxID=1213867 RepID=A0A9N9F858_9GLOM|nr:9050_t:CDS:10 [Diversispora eburnea]